MAPSLAHLITCDYGQSMMNSLKAISEKCGVECNSVNKYEICARNIIADMGKYPDNTKVEL